jgi:hypothetical protein
MVKGLSDLICLLFSPIFLTTNWTTCLSLPQSDSISDVNLSKLVGGLCLNLLSTESLFLGQIPVASKALKMSFSIKEETQAEQNMGTKSPFLTGRMPNDLWVWLVSFLEY